MKPFLLALLKWGLTLLIFAFLFYRAASNGALRGFLEVQKDWSLLLLGFAALFGAVVLTFLRWKVLAESLGVTLSVSGALRLGFIGYLFNFLPMGIVGGDVVKGVLLARENPRAKTACAVSVVMDRVIGLYVMFLIGLAAVTAAGLWHEPQKEARLACQAILWLTLLSTLFLAFVLLPPFAGRGGFLRAVPGIGRLLFSLYDAAAQYRGRPAVFFGTMLMTAGVHVLQALGIWFFACGLWGRAPSALSHLAIYPLANLGAMIPLSAGPLEFFLDQLYPLFSCTDGSFYVHGDGLMVGAAYRLATLAVAAVGGVWFLVSRPQIREALAVQRDSSEGGVA